MSCKTGFIILFVFNKLNIIFELCRQNTVESLLEDITLFRTSSETTIEISGRISSETTIEISGRTAVKLQSKYQVEQQ